MWGSETNTKYGQFFNVTRREILAKARIDVMMVAKMDLAEHPPVLEATSAIWELSDEWEKSPEDDRVEEATKLVESLVKVTLEAKANAESNGGTYKRQ